MSIELPVSFETGPDSLVLSTTMDISATGISLALKEPVAVGQIIRLTIGVGKGRTATVDAKVVWQKEYPYLVGCDYRVGLKVIDKMDQDEIAFVRFVAAKMFEHFQEKKDDGRQAP